MMFNLELLAFFAVAGFMVLLIISGFVSSFKGSTHYEHYIIGEQEPVSRVRSQFQENRRAYLERLSRELRDEVKVWEEKSVSYAETDEKLRPRPIPQAQKQSIPSIEPQPHIEIDLETSVPEAVLIPVPEPTFIFTPEESPEPIPQVHPQPHPQAQTEQAQTLERPPQQNKEVYHAEIIQLSEHRSKVYAYTDSPFARIMASRTSKTINARTQAFEKTIAQNVEPSRISIILADRVSKLNQRTKNTSTTHQTTIYQTASPPKKNTNTTTTAYGPQYHYGLDVSPVHGVRNIGRSSTRVVPVTPLYEDDYPQNPEELYQTFLEQAQSRIGEDSIQLESAIRDYKANNKAYDELRKRLANAM